MGDPRGLVALLLKSVHLASRKRVRRLGPSALQAVLRVVAAELARRPPGDADAVALFEWFMTSFFEPLQQVRLGLRRASSAVGALSSLHTPRPIPCAGRAARRLHSAAARGALSL